MTIDQICDEVLRLEEALGAPTLFIGKRMEAYNNFASIHIADLAREVKRLRGLAIAAEEVANVPYSDYESACAALIVVTLRLHGMIGLPPMLEATDGTS